LSKSYTKILTTNMFTLSELQQSLTKLEDKLKVSDLKDQISRLKSQTMEEGFWDHKNSNQIASQLGSLENQVQEFEDFKSKLSDYAQFCELIDDYELTPEAKSDFENLIHMHDKLVLASTLSGEFDKSSALVSIHSGAGGDDAQDFANMLAKMYQSYSENHSWQTQILDSDYSVSGLKHITFQIEGVFAYGNLKAEHGVHRLVRLSPFNSGNTRETSFARVDVVPILPEAESLDLNPDDLKFDTYKSSGPGGQSVNTTDSAVRVTHIPTGIQAACQNNRSQHQNKAAALQILSSKLLHLQAEQQAETLEKIRGGKDTAAFGSQIRSYTLHPYKLVKDHRTKYESKNPDQVFAGDIQPFIDEFLLK